ncbi:MAG TPA: type III pantothenate kinase [candidate division Zixibacteria bacterium]|nr:type III pantothenate kinase [candidate division Zixibacteria bacterium]
MLLAIDCGNTNTVFGIYRDKRLMSQGRFTTHELGTSSECAMAVDWFIKRGSHAPEDIKAVVIGSVVPHATGRLIEMSRQYFGIEAVVVDGMSPLGIKILYDNPKEVGTDRIMGALAAHKLYGGPCIVIDFGTATTFDVINKDGEYLGGVICPGVQTSAHSLSRRAAQLFNVDVSPPGNVIGRTTEDSIKSGLFYGTVAMVEGFVLKITEELGTSFTVIATGGYAELVSKHTRVINVVNESLVLDGLEMAYGIITGQSY